MTRIQFVFSLETNGTTILEDPRPAHELVRLINTGKLTIGGDEMQPPRQRQYAIAAPELPLVIVFRCPPPIRLNSRHYEILFAMFEGEPAAATARRLGISRRTVYAYIAELKEIIGEYGRNELLQKAVSLGLLIVPTRPVKRKSRVSRANRKSAS